MKMNIKKRTEGFTIIEVLIVLAIAGLIMLIVFLAVPALQRSSRNTGRKNDIGRIGAGLSDYVANNNGNFPANTLAFADLVGKQGNLSQYKDTDAATNASGVQGPIGSPSGTYKYRLVTSAQCDVAGSTKAGSSRQAALQYEIENGKGTNDSVCQDI